MLKIALYTGTEIIPFIKEVSKLRISIFREFPYLYQGNMDYEIEYMDGYKHDSKSTLVVVRDNNRIIGVSTGIPLNSSSTIVQEIKDILIKNNKKIDNIYYFGEVLVLPKYRGKGLVSKMYKLQENFVKQWGYDFVSILTVVRDNKHPLQPEKYQSHDELWKHLNFYREGITTNFCWPTIQGDGSVKNMRNLMEFWIKRLR